MSRETGRLITALASWLLACLAFAEDSLPVSAYIHGVPFVSWHEMRDASFPGSDVVNPSLTAAAQMMYGYWGEDFVALTKARAQPTGWESSSGEHGTLDVLRGLLARGLPVQVSPATTPDAQRLYVVPRICATLQKVPYTTSRPVSGSLGEMVPLRALAELRQGGCEAGLNDSVYVAAKLVIGYDDPRRVLTMHDPSLGPDLEIGYDDFERMWQATGAKYWSQHPRELPEVAAGRVGQPRTRTPDDDAAVVLFHAYGKSVIGEHAAAGDLLSRALGLEGLSAGRRHQLRLELAVALNETGNGPQAIEVLRLAGGDFDSYAITQRTLAQLLRSCDGSRDALKEAKKIEAGLKRLCGPQAQRRVADALGHDFHVMGCNGELLGWYRP
jgi:hypothetical protein